MERFRFTYRTTDGKWRSNIIVEAPTRESAIAVFEKDYPTLSWKVTTQLHTTLF